MTPAISISKIKHLGVSRVWGVQPACLALSRGVFLDMAGLGLGTPGAAGSPRRKLLQEEGAVPCSPEDGQQTTMLADPHIYCRLLQI